MRVESIILRPFDPSHGIHCVLLRDFRHLCCTDLQSNIGFSVYVHCNPAYGRIRRIGDTAGPYSIMAQMLLERLRRKEGRTV